MKLYKFLLLLCCTGFLNVQSQNFQEVKAKQITVQGTYFPVNGGSYASSRFDVIRIGGGVNNGIRFLANTPSLPTVSVGGVYTNVALRTRTGSGTGAQGTVTVGSSGFYNLRVQDVTITTPGSYYAMGDTLFLKGTDLGGVSESDAIVLVVTAITQTGWTAVPMAINGIEISNNPTGIPNIRNTSIGAQVLKNYTPLVYNQSANDITLVGYRAGYNAKGFISDLTAVGAGAGYNQAACCGSYFGWYAGYNQKGTGNTSMGDQSMYYDTTGVFNAAFGFSAGYKLYGSRNVLVGPQILLSSFANGDYNTLVGPELLKDAAGALAKNTIVGRVLNMSAFTTQNNNVALYDGDGVQRFYVDYLGNTFLNGNFPVVAASTDTVARWNVVTKQVERVVTMLTATATLDFPSTSGGASSDLTMTVTGAVDGDAVSLGIPNGSIAATSGYFAWISAADQVTVRFLNQSGSPADPASGTFKIKIIK